MEHTTEVICFRSIGFLGCGVFSHLNLHSIEYGIQVNSSHVCRSPWVIPMGDGGRRHLQSCKRNFANVSDACSDHLTLINAYTAWQDLGGGARQHRFSTSNSLSPATMKMISRMRDQIVGELVSCGLLQSRNSVQEMSSSAGSTAVLRCVLVQFLSRARTISC